MVSTISYLADYYFFVRSCCELEKPGKDVKNHYFLANLHSSQTHTEGKFIGTCSNSKKCSPQNIPNQIRSNFCLPFTYYDQPVVC